MIAAEESARWLLVVHAILGISVVATSTHLAIWTRRFPRGEFHRIHAVRRFAKLSLLLFLCSFVFGNILYPTYKVRVKAEFLEDGAAVTRDWENRAKSRTKTLERYRDTRALYPEAPTAELPQADRPEEPPTVALTAAKLARWFDVKEHWAALGLVLAFATALVLLTWNPKREGPALGSLVFGFALATATSAWIAAIIGLVVSSFRAVGT